MKLPKIDELSDKKLWVIAVILSCSSLFAALPIWLLLRKRKREENEENIPLKEKEEEEENGR